MPSFKHTSTSNMSAVTAVNPSESSPAAVPTSRPSPVVEASPPTTAVETPSPSPAESNQNKRPSPSSDSASEASARKKPTLDRNIGSNVSTKLKETRENINGVDVEVIQIEGDSADKDGDKDEMEWFLCKPTGVTSKWWDYFHRINPLKHPGYKDCAACLICFKNKKATQGTVKTKGGATSGLKRHMQSHHREEYDKIEAKKSNTVIPSNSRTMKDSYPTAPKEPYLGVADIKKVFKTACATWAIEEAIPFQTFTKPSFRALFKPFNKKADQITNVDRREIREEVMMIGKIAKKATEIEMMDRELSYTTDHWTGPNDETYSTLTAHWIDELWALESCMLDFSVVHGGTGGEATYVEIDNVLARYKTRRQAVLDIIGITDTTGSMGILGQQCRANGRRHGYCCDQ
eukprot:scaffold244197_cov36-Cyclotella_meneghiniana.AAC.2